MAAAQNTQDKPRRSLGHSFGSQFKSLKRASRKSDRVTLVPQASHRASSQASIEFSVPSTLATDPVIVYATSDLDTPLYFLSEELHAATKKPQLIVAASTSEDSKSLGDLSKRTPLYQLRRGAAYAWPHGPDYTVTPLDDSCFFQHTVRFRRRQGMLNGTDWVMAFQCHAPGTQEDGKTCELQYRQGKWHLGQHGLVLATEQKVEGSRRIDFEPCALDNQSLQDLIVCGRAARIWFTMGSGVQK